MDCTDLNCKKSVVEDERDNVQIMQRVLVYASETLAMLVDDMRRLEKTERYMVRWMYEISLRQTRATHELLESLGIENVETVVRRGKLGWFEHAERKVKEDWVSSCREMVVESAKPKHRARKTWWECVE
jgi:hypothetical protein